MSRFFQFLFSHISSHRTRPQPSYRPSFDSLGEGTRFSYQPIVERLEDRTMPSLIAGQVLPFITPGGALPPGIAIPPGTILPPGVVLPPGLTGPTLPCGAVNSTLLGPNLQTFAVLAGSTVTNTGSSVITGNVGLSPGSAVTGFPPGIVTPPSTIHVNDGPANTAQTELTTAYNTVANEPFNRNLTGQDLGGLTLTPGVYHFDSSAQLTGTLTLNGLNNPNARFDFQIGSTLTTASSSRVVVVNGGIDNVYWEVGSSATLGTTTAFAGNILALTSITLNTSATILCGRALARNGAVTLDTNTIDPPAASANVIYVGNLYGLLLHRAADPGAAFWVNLLNQGASPASVVQGIEHSPEYLNDVVTGLYQHYLNRTPDSGAQTWVNALENGASVEQVTEGIVSSPEFFQKEGGGTNAGYVTALYQDILNRTPSPDSGGYAYWLKALETGSVSRAEMASGFLHSQEYDSDLVSSDYQQFLGRTPDAGGLANWTQALQTGLADQVVLASILGSSEGFARNSM